MDINLTDQQREELNSADFTAAFFEVEGALEYVDKKLDSTYVDAKVKAIFQRGGKLVGYIGITYQPGEGKADVLIVPRNDQLKHIADKLIAVASHGGPESLLYEGATQA